MSASIDLSEFSQNAADALDQRSRDIFRAIVESYLETGEPMGSRSLSRQLSENISPATVRNVMSDLEAGGLIYAPHISAGRLPTHAGLRFFVDSFLQFGNLSEEEKSQIEDSFQSVSQGKTIDGALGEASQLLSGLSKAAGIVIAAKNNDLLKHIEFIPIDRSKALVVMVSMDGSVENRIVDLPPGTTAADLSEATNALNALIHGKTIHEAKLALANLRTQLMGQLNKLASRLVDAGMALWQQASETDPGHLILRGHANLVGELGATEDIETIRKLFEDIESKTGILELLEHTEEGEGVRIFIGAENKLFSHSGSSLVLAPYRDGDRKILGALGIVGPTRLNYSRIVPMVDFTAKVVSRFMR